MVEQLLVNQIIPFSNVDGSGNRCSIFVQGCQLNCLYCHNSETIKLCCHCGICVETCPVEALSIVKDKVVYDASLCTHCDRCIKICPYQSTPKARYYTIKELVDIIKKYKPYIRGITVSGGEATLYYQFLLELFKQVKMIGLTCYIDTNGFFNYSKLEPLIMITDGFLFDIKAVEKQKELCNIESSIHINNLEKLLKLNKIIEVRTVLLNNYMNQEKTLETVCNLLKNNKKVPYRLIKAHLTGLTEQQKSKIGKSIISDRKMKELSKKVMALGITVI